MFALRGLVFVQKKLSKGQHELLIVQCKERAGLIGDIGHILGKNNIIINEIKVNSEDNIVENEDHMIEIVFMVRLPSKFTNGSFFDEILNVNGVESAIWKGELGEAFLN